MNKILTLCLTFLSLTVSAQSLWTEIKDSDIQVRNDQEIKQLPNVYKTYELDYQSLVSQLELAPAEDLAINMKSDLIISLPLPDGSMQSFRVYDSPTMQPGLAAKYPMIRSFKGVSTSSDRTTVRFDIGTNGLHAAIHSPEAIYYLDPYASKDKLHYITYNVNDDPTTLPEGIPQCGTDHSAAVDFKPIGNTTGSGERADIIPLRTYRLAVACTGEFGQWKGTVENAMSDINTSVNRINQIFENEASLRYILVDNNDVLLNFDPATDPYSNTNDGGAMLQVNTNAISSRIGVNAYDLGHVYSRSCNVGGIAALGSLCNNNKGAGVTCHYSSDLDFIATGTIAHEIGHQMSAQHTFNHCDMENESLANGVQPGGGSTIMAYGAGCGAQAYVSRRDDYYHTNALTQIYNHTRVNLGDGCGESEDFGNHEPVIQMPELLTSGLFIPRKTPFYLEASATDEDGDELTYAWDPMNTGPLSNLGDPIGEAPHFRAFYPDENNYRYLPGRTTLFGAGQSDVEVLPAGNLEMKFNFTVRDNHPTGGTAVWEQIRFRTVNTPGPFAVTYPIGLGISTEISDKMEVTWDVSNTEQDPINCKFVDILLSTSSVDEFDINNCIVLAQSVPNDGSEEVVIPNVETNRGRIIVRANDNIFFAVSSNFMQVKEPTEPTIYADASPLGQKLCLPATTSIEVSTAGYAGVEGDLTLSIDGLPAGAVATFDPAVVPVGESSTLTLDFSNVLVTDISRPVITVTNPNAPDFTRPLMLDLVASDFSDLIPTTPLSGSSSVGAAPLFQWQPAQFAETYDFELSDSPTFDNVVLSSYDMIDVELASEVILEKSTVYYWRVRAKNNCSVGEYGKTQAFSTAVLACETIEASNLPLNITQSGTPTVEADFLVLTQGTIADVNLRNMEGDHTRNKDLRVDLISPEGTSVRLFGNICSQQNFRCGFDDESNQPVDCPLSQGDIFQPSSPLAEFNDESSQGVWKLSIRDAVAGNGGQLAKATLELCSNVSAANPTVVTLSTVQAALVGPSVIGPWNMEVTDTDNDISELVYTVVSMPANGVLSRAGGSDFAVGQQFTQVSINNLWITYISNGIEGPDQASFAVTDGDGGWVGILDLDINVDAGISTATDDADLDSSISIYPNPATDFFTVTTAGHNFDAVILYDIKGQQLVSKTNTSGDFIIDASNFSSGIYLLEGRSAAGTFTKKVVIR